MKISTHHISITAALITALFMLSGCDVDHSAEAPDTKQQLIQTLENRYNDKFTLISNAGGGNMTEHCALYLSSEKLPDDRIYAVHGVFDGKIEDRDNYMAYYLRDGAENYLSQLAEDVYGSCKVFYAPDRTTALPTTVDMNSTAEEMLQNSKCTCTIILPNEKDENIRNSCLSKLSAKAVSKDIQFYLYAAYIDDEAYYSKISSADELDMTHVAYDCLVSMDNNFNSADVKWGGRSND